MPPPGDHLSPPGGGPCRRCAAVLCAWRRRGRAAASARIARKLAVKLREQAAIAGRSSRASSARRYERGGKRLARSVRASGSFGGAGNA